MFLIYCVDLLLYGLSASNTCPLSNTREQHLFWLRSTPSQFLPAEGTILHFSFSIVTSLGTRRISRCFICSQEGLAPLPYKNMSTRCETDRPITTVFLIWGGINTMTLQSRFSSTTKDGFRWCRTAFLRYRESIKRTGRCIFTKKRNTENVKLLLRINMFSRRPVLPNPFRYYDWL